MRRIYMPFYPQIIINDVVIVDGRRGKRIQEHEYLIKHELNRNLIKYNFWLWIKDL